MAGCSGPDDDGAAGPADSVTGEQALEQRRKAEAMAACLQDEGVPAVLKEFDGMDGQAEVWIEDGVQFWEICWEEGCTMGGGAGLAANDFEAAKKQNESVAASRVASALSEAEAKPWLIVGGEDLTETYMRCWEKTSYVRPGHVPADPTEELREKKEIAAAGVEWAECARSNGYPATKDPAPPVADDWASWPTAALPAGITEQQFRELLTVCPSFDWEAQEAADKQAAGQPDMTNEEYAALVPARPGIGFDVPCKDGSALQCDEETWAKYNPFSMMVEELWNEYLSSHPN
jgi:hypothetical protein